MSRGRILCVTSNFPRWAGDSTTSFVLHLAEDLQSLGWEVDVLAPHAEGAAMRERIGKVHVERFRYLWPASAETVCYQGGALINLRKHPSNVLKLPALVAAEWWAIMRRLMSRRYDLLHSHWLLPQGFVGVLAARLLHTPHVVTVHGSDVFALNGKLLKSFKRMAMQHADAVTVNSSATGQAVNEIGPGSSPVKRIPMGVCTDFVAKTDPRVRALRDRYRREQGPLLVFAGRVVEEKGVGDLIQAMHVLRVQHPDVTLLVVGEGQDRAMMEERCARHGVGDRVHFTGWVEPGEIPLYLAAGDIYVGPSWHEAQGLTFIEAMVAGTPVVATGVGGIVDSVQHEITGLLVEKQSPDEIVAAVDRLVKEEGLAERLCSTARKRVEERFSRQASAAAFDELFVRLVRESGRRGRE
jgi:glycosyltransferase involved in cell wall biosynthesis